MTSYLTMLQCWILSPLLRWHLKQWWFPIECYLSCGRCTVEEKSEEQEEDEWSPQIPVPEAISPWIIPRNQDIGDLGADILELAPQGLTNPHIEVAERNGLQFLHGCLDAMNVFIQFIVNLQLLLIFHQCIVTDRILIGSMPLDIVFNEIPAFLLHFGSVIIMFITLKGSKVFTNLQTLNAQVSMLHSFSEESG